MDNKGKNVGAVVRTKNYSLFKFREDNREIRESKVKSIYRDMLVNGWISGSHAIVNEKFDIIDGQHRIKAAIRANVPVDYVVVKGANSKTIRKLNTKKTNWNIIDHIHGYVKEGNQNYILLDRFMRNFPTLRPTECTMLVRNSTSSAERESFEDGNFVVRDMKKAYEWAHQIMKLKPYFERGYNKSIFVRAMIRIFVSKPEFVFDEFLHKVQLRPKSIFMCGTVEQYLEMIEDIYNYKRKSDDKLNLRF